MTTAKIVTYREHHAIVLMHPYELMHQGQSYGYMFRGVPKHIIELHQTVLQRCPQPEGAPLRFQVVKHTQVTQLYGKTLWKPDNDFESSPLHQELFGNYDSIEYAHDGEFLYVEIHDPVEQMTFFLSNTNYETDI